MCYITFTSLINYLSEQFWNLMSFLFLEMIFIDYIILRYELIKNFCF